MGVAGAAARSQTHWVKPVARRAVTGALVALLALALPLLPLLPAPGPHRAGIGPGAASAAEPWKPPALVRTIGGTGRASLFPWGLAWNPVSQRWIVGDYFNYQVRTFDADWRSTGVLPQPSAASGDPESVLASVAVDPRTGETYVGKPKPDTLAHYAADGTRLPDVVVDPTSGSQTYTAWVTVDDEGYVWVLDSHLWNTDADPSRLIRLAPGGGAQVSSWDLSFPGQKPGQFYGIDVGSDGRVYLADAVNRRVQVLSPDGTLIRSIGTSGEADVPGALSGDLRSVVVDDEAGRLYVVDAVQDQVEVFDLDGRPLLQIGGHGTEPGRLVAPRQLAFGPEGDLWVSEYGNYRIQAFDPLTGASRGVEPTPLPERPGGQLGQPRDVGVDPATGEVWVADSWNQRFCRYAADGTWTGCWGGRGNTPPYGVKYPRGIAVDAARHRVWVSNNAGGTIFVYDDEAGFLFQVGEEGNRRNNEPGMLEKPFGMAFGSGYAYVADPGSTYENSSAQVKVLDADTGAQVATIARNARTVAVDEATGLVYVADTGTNQQKIYVYGPTGGPALRSFGGRGTAAGKFTGLWGVTVSDGVVYATDEAQSRVQAFTTGGAFLGRWGSVGSGPLQLRNPAGITHDAAGLLYVADSSNDRVVVLDPGRARPAYLFSRPTLTLTSPATGSVTPGPVVIEGLAGDDRSLASVEVSVLDRATGLWWDPTTATWATAQTWGLAPWSGSPTSARWRWVFPGAETDHDYHLEARARDADGTVSAPVRSTEVSVREPDPVAPSTTVTPPGTTLLPGAVALSGDAGDDRGVAAVRWAVQHVRSGRWWTGSAWAVDPTWSTATLAAPGATSTGWSATWTPPAAEQYVVVARAVDTGGGEDPVGASASFVVDLAEPDRTGAETRVTSPTAGQVLPPGDVVLAGRATDLSGVGWVDVALQDRATGRWWDAATGAWGPFTWNDGASTPAARFASPTTWSWTWPALAPGAYRMGARARDGGGRADATPAWVDVSVG